MRRKRRGAAKNETMTRMVEEDKDVRVARMAKAEARMADDNDQEGKFGEGEVTKLGEEQSLLLTRMKRQLVGSER